MTMTVWFLELDQRAGDYHFMVRTSEDGMLSQYIRRSMVTDTEVKKIYRGESSLADANRAFTEDVIKEVHGNGVGT